MNANPALPFGIAAYLAGIQFVFALGWTVYVLFLPELLARAGIDKSWTPWVLALDQAVFAVADLAMGVAMDRSRAALRNVGGWLLALVAVSSVAMLAMPAASGIGPAPFLALTLVWVVTSAALRAPPFALLGRYAATSSVPALAGLMLFGMAAAAAVAPYLGLQLKGIDPMLPFAAASLAILLSSGGLVVAERRLAGSASSGEAGPGTPLPFASPVALIMLAGLLLATIGFQLQVGINAAAQVKRIAGPDMLPWLLPAFWGGFAFGLLGAGPLGNRAGQAPAAAAGCIGGALALAAAAHAGTPAMLATAHALAGAAWAVCLSNAFGLASAAGRSGAEGRYTGILFSLLALGTLARILLGLSGTPAALQGGTDWLPVVAWGAAAMLLLAAGRRRVQT